MIPAICLTSGTSWRRSKHAQRDRERRGEHVCECELPTWGLGIRRKPRGGPPSVVFTNAFYCNYTVRGETPGFPQEQPALTQVLQVVMVAGKRPPPAAGVLT
eukprot:1248717-Prymnesium_polylepis.1